MTLEEYKFRLGDIEYDIFKCEGEGQCQCKRCRDKGIYNASWTSWFYQLNKNDNGVLCRNCVAELLIQRRSNDEIAEQAEEIECLKAEIEQLTEREKFLENAWETSLENTKIVERGLKASEARNAELQKQVDEWTSAFIPTRARQQAVKDTAKEILDKAIIIDKNTGNKGFICIEALTELCKSKGVEVE